MVTFVGRERELATLRASLGRALQGDGSLVLVSGEAGIGKTSLVRELIDEIERHQALMLSGACYDLSTTPPYGPWLEMTERYPANAQLPELPNVLKRGTGVGDLVNQLDLFEVARTFFVSVAEQRPLVLVMEDVHWSDQASLDLLRYLVRWLTGHRILLITTFRDDTITRHHPLFVLLPALIRETQPTRIELSVLSRNAVQALVSSRWSLSPDDEERLVAHLLAHAEGQPLFTVEMLRTLEQNDFIWRGQDGWQVADLSQGPVPVLVRQVIGQRVAQLDEKARRRLEIAAVIGHQVQLDVWRTVAGTSDEELFNGLDQAIALRLLDASPDGHHVSFVHALIREALYTDILPPRRRTWHRLIAEALASSAPSPDSDAVAYHFQQAGDPRAVEWLMRAGEWAESILAWPSAVDRFLAVITVLAEDDERVRERGWLRYRVARLSYYVDPTEGVESLNEAIQLAVRTGDDVLHWASLIRRGHLRCFTGDVQRGIDEMLEGVKSWDRLSLEQKRSCEYWDLVDSDLYLNLHRPTLMLWLALVGRYRECLQHADAFLKQIHPKRERLARRRYTFWADGYVGIGLTHAAMGRPEKAREMFELAREGFRATGLPTMESQSGMSILRDVFIPYQTQRVTERYSIAEEIEDVWIRAKGVMRSPISPRLQVIQLLVLDGAWREVKELAALGMVSHSNAARLLELMLTIGRVARNQGDGKLAWEQVRIALPEGPATEPGNSFFFETRELVGLAAHLALDDSRLDNARAWLEAHDRWLDWSGAVRGRAEGLLLWGQLYQAEGDAEAGREYAHCALKQASHPEQPLAQIAIHRFLGELATRNQDLDEAELHLQRSLARAEACALPFERALTLLAKAELEATRDSKAETRQLLTEVRRICSALGARPALERTERLMNKLDSRRSDSRYGLTSRELEVLGLLVEGKSDKEIANELFISHHTVMRHVSHILAKLNVNSRTAAASQAVRHSII